MPSVLLVEDHAPMRATLRLWLLLCCVLASAPQAAGHTELWRGY